MFNFIGLNFIYVRHEVNQIAYYVTKYVIYNLDWMCIEYTPSYISDV